MKRTTDNNFNLGEVSKSGFTIIELMVVIALMVILTTVIILRQRTFNNTILLRNTAYEFALSIREAQAYSISVYRDAGDAIGRYGIHISLSLPGSTILYIDKDKDDMYDVGEKKQTNILQPFSVRNICVTVLDVEECADDIGSTITGLEVLFIRPSPEAHLYVMRSAGGFTSVSKARVSIGTPENKSVDVVISSIGQVSVQ